jgi:DNA-binding transcriptional MerR regulator
MHEILFYRELDFSLKRIKEILSSPHYDRNESLKDQRILLILKKERLERLICAIDGELKGENVVSAFDNGELERYKAEAKEKWGKTDAYRQYEQKAKGYSKQKQAELARGLDGVMADFAACMKNGHEPGSADAQGLVKRLQEYICANYYDCTDEILSGLGQMYVSDERFTENIDKHAEGTAKFISEAIKIRYKKQM